MRAKSSMLILLSVCMVLGGSCAQAVVPVVTVTPEAMQGWSIEANAKGWGALSPWGPSTYENMPNSGSFGDNQWPSSPFPFNGKGSFYATCDYFKATGPAKQNDWTPSTVWLGTDQWNGSSVAGRTLGSITAMEYYSFVSKIPQRWAGANGGGEVEYWTKNGWWNSWQQPISMTLTAESPDKTERRQFWNRPWGGNYVGDDGMKQKGYWQKLNCLTTKWYTPLSADVAVDPDADEFGCGTWVELMANSLKLKFADDPAGDTPARTAPFSEWTLVATSNNPYPAGWKSPGWSDGTFPVDPRTTTLTAQVEIGATSVQCASTTDLLPKGTARIDGDYFAYTGMEDDTVNNLHYLTGCTGVDAQHLIGAVVCQPTPPTEPIGHPSCTATGKPINFEIGSRCGQGDVNLQGAYGGCWANHTYGFRGQVDYFTLGFDGTSVTYDFEPSATEKPVRVVGTNIKSLGRQIVDNNLDLATIIQGAYFFNPVKGSPDIPTGSPEMAQKKFLFKVSGKVTRWNQGNWDSDFKQWKNSYFLIEDGSKLVYTDSGVTPNPVLSAPVWVFLPPNRDLLRIYVGDYVSVYGFVEPMRWKNVGTPLIMWSTQKQVTEMKYL